MKSIFEKDSYNELANRLDKLNSNSTALWGKMTVEQMLVHCRKTVEYAMGDSELQAPHPIKIFLANFTKASLYNDKPFKKNLSTIKDFVINEHDNFDVEKKRLKLIIRRMHTSEKFFFPYTYHQVYGRLEPYMWGQSVYKHLDHHFKQFGV